MGKNQKLGVLVLLAFLLLPAEVSGQPLTDKETVLSRLSHSFEILAEQINGAVVQIFTTSYRSLGDSEANLLQKRRSGGSGVILDPGGHIVTNAHVVRNAQRVEVLLPPSAGRLNDWSSIVKPKGELVPAEIVGVDAETDLAVLKVAVQDLPFLELADSDKVRQGQLVLAFGSPLGLEDSVSLGVVSSVARQLRPEDPVVYIQTDAPINPGSSGGPLVDTRGKMVGINTFIFTQSGGNEGLGFALPSNIVRNVFTQIRDTGYVRRGEIGVHAQTVTPAIASVLGLAQEWGVLLGDVVPGSPADVAGLEVGDLVLRLNGKSMENGRQFDVNLYGYRIGDLITLEVLRKSKKLTLTVPVIERQNDFARFAGMVTEKNLVPELGILGIDIDGEIAKLLFPLRRLEGVLVAARSGASQIWQEILFPGDVIYSVNGQSVSDVSGLRHLLGSLEPGDPVVIQIQRRHGLRFVALEVE